MAIDLKAPIDISAVIGAVRKHQDVLQSIDKLDVNDVLVDCTPMSGITDSITLGKKEGGKMSSKYTGIFIGAGKLGKIVPRKLTVYPCVAEMEDEPERYRRSFIADVQGGVWDKKHPFEAWLINDGLTTASQDLHNVIFIAKYTDAEDKTELEDSFDGWGAILMDEKKSGAISTELGNMYATGELSDANIGDKLLAMWRNMPKTFRKKNSVMWISEDLGDMYDDWKKAETIQMADTDESQLVFLKGTNKRCKLKRTNAFPEGSCFVLLTTRNNMVYGFDKISDLKDMRPFNNGNPYTFTATMKYVWGTQFISIHSSELCINDQPLTPSGVEVSSFSFDELNASDESEDPDLLDENKNMGAEQPVIINNSTTA